MTDHAANRDELDPVFLNGRREAIAVFLTWVVAFLWAVPYCATHAYMTPEGSELKTIIGVPEWTFWGIFVPWLIADVVTVWLCFSFMTDDDLEAAAAESELLNGESEVAR